MTEHIYIGTKIIAAEEMDEREFNISMEREWDGSKAGRPGYKVRYEDGYVSWSPKETFERAYRKISPSEIAMVSTEKLPDTPTWFL